MSSPSAPPDRLALAAIAAQPWKNGAGLTRELAVEPQGAGTADFHWRVSIAEVDRDAPFSAFPGVDRSITLLRGAGMRLASADGSFDHRLDRVLAPFAFSGDLALDATLLEGGCSDFNVMTRRGAWRAEVSARQHAFESGSDADALLLLCIVGAWEIEAGATDHDASWSLATDQALLWRERCGLLWATPLEADATLLVVQLCHDRPR